MIFPLKSPIATLKRRTCLAEQCDAMRGITFSSNFFDKSNL